jgi:diacylglycerol O-acyltransferase / wax synthase
MDHQLPVLSRRLSGSDAAFLYLERKEIPLNIACVALFDGPIPFDEFVANIDSKLDLIPRYRQVVVPPPLNLGYPVWENDSNFDIQRHIFPVRLDPPGGQAELEALAGRLLSRVLDRSKPLWEIHIVDGLKDGQGALIARIHHALADGVAGAALLKIMFDPTPEGSLAVRRAPKRAPKTNLRQPTPPPAGQSLTEQVSGAIQSALENAVAAQAGLLSLTEALFSDRGKSALQQLTALLPEWLLPAERFPFNKPCSGDRMFCWAAVDFAEVQAIRAALGGKVNDCILSVVVRAIARYIRLHKEKVKGRFLRVVCPVNLRGDETGESLGNRITFLPVVLPLDVSDPVEMLHAVASRMEIMKNVRAAELVAIVGSCLGATPAPMQEMFWRALPLVPLPVPLLNLICTNIPGSPSALYTVGRRMVASYPQVPTGYELGLAVAVQSYDGKLFFGLTADAHVAPDVARLRDAIQVSFADLAKAAGVKRGRSRPSVPRAGKTQPAKRTKPQRHSKAAKSTASAAPPLAPEPTPAAAPAQPVEPPTPATVRAPRFARRTKPQRRLKAAKSTASATPPAAQEPAPTQVPAAGIPAAAPAQPVEPPTPATTPAAELSPAISQPAKLRRPAEPVEFPPSAPTPTAQEPTRAADREAVAAPLVDASTDAEEAGWEDPVLV